MALLLDDRLGREREDAADTDFYRRAFAALLASAENDLYVVEHADGVVGCFQLTLTPGLSHRGATRATIESVRVRTDLRKAGIGFAMTRHAVAVVRGRGARIVQLTAHENRDAAQRIYARLGFRPSHVGIKLDLGDTSRE